MGRSGAEMSDSVEVEGTAPSLPAPGKRRPAMLVVHAWVAEQVTELARRDAEIRQGSGAGEGADEGIHKARVACRRLRGALATYRPLLDRQVTDPIREELRWLARALGPARDLDVAHVRLRRLLDGEPPHLVLGPVAERLDETYGRRRHEAHAAAREALTSERYAALRESLDRLVAAPPWTDRAGEDARDVLPRRVRSEFRRLRRRVLAVQDLAGDRERRDEAVHAARRAAKRLRYAAESLQPVWGSDAKRLAKAATRFAAELGTRQDAVVAAADLLALAREADAAGESAFTYGRLHAHEQHVVDEIDARFDSMWTRVAKPRLRSWL